MTSPGGRINVSSPGEFGPVLIDRSVTIDGSGSQASIVDSPTTPVDIAADVTGSVVLKGLNLTSTAYGAKGIEIESARDVLIEDCVVGGFLRGLVVSNASGDAFVTVRRSSFFGDWYGMVVAPTASGRATVSFEDSLLSGDFTGITSIGSSKVTVARSSVTNLTYAFSSTEVGHLTQVGTNVLINNLHLYKYELAPVPSTATQFSGRAKSGAKFGFSSTLPANATVTISSGLKVVARFRAPLKASNLNSITWNGKSGSRFVAKGTYALQVDATTSEGQDGHFTGTVKLT